MYYRFGKVFHFLSILLFIFVFLYTYSALPDLVGFEQNESGEFTKSGSKSTFFYIGIIVFGVLNLILALPAKMIEKQSTPNLKRLFPKGDTITDYLVTWMYSFMGMINVSLCIMSLFVHAINNQNEIGTSSFSFFFYLVPVLFVVWIIALFWILLQKFKSIQK
jgi:hypothetical protein